MDQKIKTIWPLAFVLAALVLPLAAIMLIMFSVTVSVVIPIYEFLQLQADRRHDVLTKVLATPMATRLARQYRVLNR